jgi:hypothetical protein
LRTSANEIPPLYFVEPVGKGSWVAVDHPGLFAFHRKERGAERVDWPSFESRLGLLNAILRAEAGTEPADYLDVNVTQSKGMVLASRPRELRRDFSRTRIPFVRSGKSEPVLFDTYGRERVMPHGYDATTGRGVLLGDLSDPFAVGLWLVKDSDRPRMLYADGTFKHMARVDDGRYEQGRRILNPTFAERA